MELRRVPRPIVTLDGRRSQATSHRLRLIGGFALDRFAERIELSEAAQRLLAYLALQARPTPRQRVAGTFWPDTSDERALGNLRTTLWRLNRPRPPVVSAAGDAIALADDVAVDLRELTVSARAFLDGSGGAGIDAEDVEELEGAGELLPDWSDDWILGERERFRQLRLHALERLSGRLADEGRYGRAVEVCLVAVASEPLRESARRQLMRIHLAEGNLVEAVREYESYRVLILDELGVEPSSAMVRLLDECGVGVPLRIDRERRNGQAGRQAARVPPAPEPVGHEAPAHTAPGSHAARSHAARWPAAGSGRRSPIGPSCERRADHAALKLIVKSPPA